MSKKIISLLTIIVLLMTTQVFALASEVIIDVPVTDGKAYKADNLKNGYLEFALTSTGVDGVRYKVSAAAINEFYYDGNIRYYDFIFTGANSFSLKVRTDKNQFNDFSLDYIQFTVSEKGFSVSFAYKDKSVKALTELKNPATYTLSQKGAYSTHHLATVGGKRVNCKSSSADAITLETTLLGEIKPVKQVFRDVADSNKWYYRYVNEAGAYGIVGGVGDNLYQPARNVTRAELATLIVEATKHILKFEINEDISFKDVPADKWYYKYINMCANAGLMSGMGEGMFEPNSTATREQIALVAANYVRIIGGFNGKDLPATDKNTAGAELAKIYKDGKSVHSWAAEGVLLCYKLEIMQGDGGSFYPVRQLSRAESAKIFHDLYFKSIK